VGRLGRGSMTVGAEGTWGDAGTGPGTWRTEACRDRVGGIHHQDTARILWLLGCCRDLAVRVGGGDTPEEVGVGSIRRGVVEAEGLGCEADVAFAALVAAVPVDWKRIAAVEEARPSPVLEPGQREVHVRAPCRRPRHFLSGSCHHCHRPPSPRRYCCLLRLPQHPRRLPQRAHACDGTIRHCWRPCYVCTKNETPKPSSIRGSASQIASLAGQSQSHLAWTVRTSLPFSRRESLVDSIKETPRDCEQERRERE
jgi:hypothetical protein